MKRIPAPLRILAGTAVLLALAELNLALAATLADSRTEFSGVQGANGWYWGYRNVPYLGGTDYDPAVDFIPFPGGSNDPLPWDGY